MCVEHGEHVAQRFDPPAGVDGEVAVRTPRDDVRGLTACARRDWDGGNPVSGGIRWTVDAWEDERTGGAGNGAVTSPDGVSGRGLSRRYRNGDRTYPTASTAAALAAAGTSRLCPSRPAMTAGPCQPPPWDLWFRRPPKATAQTVAIRQRISEFSYE